jgi:hypothetical protein
MSELSDAEKATFRAATERRKALGIRLRKICFMAEAAQVEDFNFLWEGWVERFGKRKAVDVLIKLMSEIECRIREEDERRNRKA